MQTLARAALLICCAIAPPGRAQADPGAVFEQAWALVRDEFYDPGLHGIDWEAVRAELLPRAEAAGSAAELSAVINEALARLDASHTRHYHPGESAFYELRDIFSQDGSVSYVGIGIVATEIDGRVFVADVYDGGPARAAGLLAGDEIVSVEGEPWRDVDSFLAREGERTVMSIRRSGPAGAVIEVAVVPAKIQPYEMFLESIEKSARVRVHGGVKVGYVRVRSYASIVYHESVMHLATGELAEADALILDIRAGWGGARPAYMSLVNPVVPAMEIKPRAGEWRTFTDAWHKPLVLLIDGGSRSGKEILAYAYKEHGLATLVGERTAGAVLAGQLRMLDDGSALYLAASDVLVDGVRLEGVGVAPDIEVARDLPYSAGRDPQLGAALDEAARLVHERRRMQDD